MHLTKGRKAVNRKLLSHLVIPAADTELSAEAVTGRTVVGAAAVLEHIARVRVVLVRFRTTERDS